MTWAPYNVGVYAVVGGAYTVGNSYAGTTIGLPYGTWKIMSAFSNQSLVIRIA